MTYPHGTPTVLAISGSLRAESLNSALLDAAERLAPRDVRWVRYRGLGSLPHFNEDEEFPTPAAVLELRARVQEADGMLIATPEYNASVPGALKNAIDWLSRTDGGAASPLSCMPVAIIGASQGPFGTVRAQLALRQILQKLNSAVVAQPEFLLGAAQTQLREAPGLAPDSTSANLLCQVVEQLLRLVDGSQRHRKSTAVHSKTPAED